MIANHQVVCAERHTGPDNFPFLTKGGMDRADYFSPGVKDKDTLVE
jgi:hypothetical protein